MQDHKYKDELTELERTYRSNICGMVCYACKFVKADVAYDIVQNVFLKLWNHDRSFFSMTDRTAQQLYLYKCVSNACQDYLKHIKVTENHSDAIINSIRLQEVHWYDSFMDKEEHSLKMKQLMSLVQKLPPRCREIFQLHYIEQKSCPEIAAMLGLSVRTVETQVYKALQFLRKWMKESNE